MKKIFKTLFSLLVVLGLVSVAVACNKTEEKTEAPAKEKNTYHVVGGHFNDWNDYTDANKMTKISVDELDASLKAKLLNKDVTAVLKLEGREFNADYAWTTPAYVNEKAVDLDGGYTIKVVYAEYDEADDTTFAKQWCPDPKTAAVQNLTPETLFVPKWVETPAAGEEHLGKWDQNPVVTAGAGKYTVYFVEYAGANSADSPKYAMAVVKTQELEENVRKEFDVLSTLQTTEEVYKLEIKDGKATVAAEKKAGTEWANLNAPVYDVAHMKSLRFTISGDCTTFVKIESSAGNKQVELILSAEAKAYEWDLSGEEEQKVLAGENVKVLFFVMAGVAEGKGNVTLENVKFSVDKAMFNPIESGYNNYPVEELPDYAQIYDGTSEIFNINGNWRQNEKNTVEINGKEEKVDTYTFEYNEDKSVSVNYDVNAGYQYAFAYLAGEYQNFEFATIEITGTKGQELMLKAEGAKIVVEKVMTFNGEKQVLSINLTKHHWGGGDVTAADRKEGFRILIMAAPGKGGKGSFTIHNCYLGTEDETNLGTLPIEPVVYNGNPNQAPNLATLSWHDNGDKVYTVQKAADAGKQGQVYISYKKASTAEDEHAQEWSTARIQIDGKQLGDWTKIKAGINMAKDKQLLFKLGGAGVPGDNSKIEYWYTGTGSYDDSFVFDLTKLTAEERNCITEILVFAEGGKTNVEGGFEIHWMSLDGYTGPAVDGNVLKVNKGFTPLDAGAYTPVEKNGKVEITYAKPGQYNFLMTRTFGDLTQFTKIKYNITSETATKFLFKIEGGKGVEVTLKCNEAGEIDLATSPLKDALKDGFKILIVIDPEVDKGAGSFTIETLEFTK